MVDDRDELVEPLPHAVVERRLLFRDGEHIDALRGSDDEPREPVPVVPEMQAAHADERGLAGVADSRRVGFQILDQADRLLPNVASALRVPQAQQITVSLIREADGPRHYAARLNGAGSVRVEVLL
jgi:hypothetical protein